MLETATSRTLLAITHMRMVTDSIQRIFKKTTLNFRTNENDI